MIKIVAVLATALIVATGCSDGGGRESSEADIVMDVKQDFDPENFTVKAGETIAFENVSSEAHTVTAYEEDLPAGAEYFASGGAGSEEEARANLADGLIQADETFELTLDQPGTYRYFCIPHEGTGMIGTITVTE